MLMSLKRKRSLKTQAECMRVAKARRSTAPIYPPVGEPESCVSDSDQCWLTFHSVQHPLVERRRLIWTPQPPLSRQLPLYTTPLQYSEPQSVVHVLQQYYHQYIYGACALPGLFATTQRVISSLALPFTCKDSAKKDNSKLKILRI